MPELPAGRGTSACSMSPRLSHSNPTRTPRSRIQAVSVSKCTSQARGDARKHESSSEHLCAPLALIAATASGKALAHDQGQVSNNSDSGVGRSRGRALLRIRPVHEQSH
jgi:hypothetical protein